MNIGEDREDFRTTKYGQLPFPRTIGVQKRLRARKYGSF